MKRSQSGSSRVPSNPTHSTSAQFETIKTGRQEVAQLTNDNGTEIAVYHDNSASKRGLLSSVSG